MLLYLYDLTVPNDYGIAYNSFVKDAYNSLTLVENAGVSERNSLLYTLLRCDVKYVTHLEGTLDFNISAIETNIVTLHQAASRT